MKKEINVFDYAQDILKGVNNGVLLTTQSGETVNTMTISWGTLGIEWGKPIFTTFVRQSRYSKLALDETGEFTVNIPYGDFDKSILSFCGTKSGRDVDKIKELGLTLERSDVVCPPAIKELPLTLECRVIYKQTQDPSQISREAMEQFYPETEHGCPDIHTAYYGEIVRAYIIQ